MKKKQFVRRFAGFVITAASLAGWFIHEYFYLLTLFAGLNLMQSSFTGFCLPENFYDRFFRDKTSVNGFFSSFLSGS